jgi:tryptophan halogenase
MKIVIVGGGSAGWLTAAYLANQNQIYKKNNLEQIDITVIDSSEIPIIGAGEGVTALMRHFVMSKFNELGKSEMDFIMGAGALPKYGIRFKDWNGVGTEFLSPLHGSTTALSEYDSDFLSAVIAGDYYDSSISGYMMARGLTDFHATEARHMAMHAYHFNANMVGQYFKKLCIEHGVKHIDAKLHDIELDPLTGYCQKVKLVNHDDVEADFWIDCTGNAKFLISRMGAKWVSYANELPVNSALPYIHQYDDPCEAKLETLSWSMPNGWMWQAPVQERYGCGYVYSDKFVNDNQALAELERTTGRNIQPIRKFNFEVGRLDRSWIKNVAAFGLASSFLEPLQATSIHSTLVQVDTLFTKYFSKDINTFLLDQNIKKYNASINLLLEQYKDLVRIHYYNKREDSEFWRFCKYELPMSDNVKEIIEICKHRCPSSFDFGDNHGTSGWGVWCWTLYGLGTLPKSSIINTAEKFAITNNVTKLHKDLLSGFDGLSKSLKKQPDLIKEIINKTI